MLIGPTAEDLPDKEDREVTTDGLMSIETDVKRLVPNVNFRDTIKQYAGLRPNRVPEGLHVDTWDDLKGFINLSGVRSTGLTLSVAMGKYVAEKIKDCGFTLTFKENFIKKRKGIRFLRDMTEEEKKAAIRENPMYGNIICRCETVTEAEIVDAIHRPLGAHTIDGIKRRTRANTGRCQAGFCGPKCIEILAREWNIPVEEVEKNMKGSYMVAGKNK